MEWREGKILEFVNQGWSLSWDKANQRYKLQKRVNGRVKSYTLPREFNNFCEELKGKRRKKNLREIVRGAVVKVNDFVDKHYRFVEANRPFCGGKIEVEDFNSAELLGIFAEELDEMRNKVIKALCGLTDGSPEDLSTRYSVLLRYVKSVGTGFQHFITG